MKHTENYIEDKLLDDWNTRPVDWTHLAIKMLAVSCIVLVVAAVVFA